RRSSTRLRSHDRFRLGRINQGLAFGRRPGWAHIILILRRREPNMARPLRIGGPGRGGEAIGWFAVVLTIALLAQYLPGMPAQLDWQPWVIFLAWWFAGAFFYYRLPRGIRAGEDVEERLARAMRERER